MMVHQWTETCRPVSSKVYKDITLLCLMVYFTLIFENKIHIDINLFDHEDLGNYLLQLCPHVTNHPVYICCMPHKGFR